jgi:hypothetical protein
VAITWLVPARCATNWAVVVPHVPPGMHDARCELVAPVWLRTVPLEVGENVQLYAPRVTTNTCPTDRVIVLPLSASPAVTVAGATEVGGALTVVADRTVVAVVTVVVVTGIETVVDVVGGRVEAGMEDVEATR